MGGFLRGVMVLALLVALVGGGVLVYPAAKDLWRQYNGQQRADTALNAGDWTAARTQLEALANQYPTDATIGLKLAQALEAESQQLGQVSSVESLTESKKLHQKAAQRLLVLWQQFPKNTAVGLAYGRFLANDLQHHPNAVAVYRALLQAHEVDKGKKSSQTAAILQGTGQLYYQAAQFQPDAERKHWLAQWADYYLRAAIRQQPTAFDPRFQLGLLHQQQVNPATSGAAVDASAIELHSVLAARSYCNAALIKPNDVETRYNLGLSLVTLGVLEDGFAHMKTAVDLLVASDQVPRAQAVSEAMQTVKNNVYYQPDARHWKASEKDELLGQCLADPRLSLALLPKTTDTASEKPKE